MKIKPKKVRLWIGDYVKICRFGEALWVKITRRFPGATFAGIIENDPLVWANPDGSPVCKMTATIFTENEVIEILHSPQGA